MIDKQRRCRYNTAADYVLPHNDKRTEHTSLCGSRTTNQTDEESNKRKIECTHCRNSFAYKENTEKTAAHQHETKCEEFDNNANTSFIMKL